MPDLSVSLGSLKLKNPVLVAAGTFGYGLEFAASLPLESLGGVVLKTVTSKPREGNAPPRLAETPSGMLNAVGLQNVGLDRLITETLPALKRYAVPVIVSILGESPQELAAMTAKLSQLEEVSAIELNLSCPNVRHPANTNARFVGLVAHDAAASSEMVKAARQATSKPLIAKLSPDVTDLTPIALAVEQAGADAVTIANTFVGMSIDSKTRRSRLGSATGGLSGPAIRPLAVYRVWYTAQILRIPIIGLGGIVSAEDALEFLFAGATAVAVGTANFADPRAALKVIRGIERFLNDRGLASARELRASLWDGTERRAEPFER